MTSTIIITQITGIILSLTGLSVVINKKGTSRLVEDITRSTGLLWIYGFVVLTIGAIIVVFNNTWTSGLPLFITIIGWLSVIKGVWIMMFSESTMSLYKKMGGSKLLLFSGSLCLLLGLFLLYFGFI